MTDQIYCPRQPVAGSQTLNYNEITIHRFIYRYLRLAKFMFKHNKLSNSFDTHFFLNHGTYNHDFKEDHHGCYRMHSQSWRVGI